MSKVSTTEGFHCIQELYYVPKVSTIEGFHSTVNAENWIPIDLSRHTFDRP